MNSPLVASVPRIITNDCSYSSSPNDKANELLVLAYLYWYDEGKTYQHKSSLAGWRGTGVKTTGTVSSARNATCGWLDFLSLKHNARPNSRKTTRVYAFSASTATIPWTHNNVTTSFCPGKVRDQRPHSSLSASNVSRIPMVILFEKIGSIPRWLHTIIGQRNTGRKKENPVKAPLWPSVQPTIQEPIFATSATQQFSGSLSLFHDWGLSFSIENRKIHYSIETVWVVLLAMETSAIQSYFAPKIRLLKVIGVSSSRTEKYLPTIAPFFRDLAKLRRQPTQFKLQMDGTPPLRRQPTEEQAAGAWHAAAQGGSSGD